MSKASLAPVSLDTATLRLLAVASNTDPRTVRKRLTGGSVRGICAERIDDALSRLGYAKPPIEAESQGVRVA